ncbi:hypothetical protein [Hyunsoonleella aestuarii]|uniref:PorT family protein n=1 Tax=Hyunsoonleella aestuarii TaxID=912802 RepID=A0ABP8E954_9FLAO|nr:hypothetical protein [Hyunsoonleella aestuarii]
MKINSLILLVAITVGFVTKSFAQPRNYDITNGIGVFGGITKFDIQTDNFVTEQGNGFLFGMSATVDLPHRWYNMSYGMQLSENYIDISGRPDIVSSQQEFIEYKMFAAQLALLGHIKLIGSYLTIDVGPMLQYNGKLELENDNQENYYINNYTNLQANDIVEISRFNFNGLIGASVGYKFFRLKAQYIHGFTNILRKLEDESLDTIDGDERFEGNQSMLVFGAMISF